MRRIPMLLVLLAGTAAADPWVDEKPGHGAFFFGFSDTRADDYFAGPSNGPCPSFTCSTQKEGSRYPIGIPYPAFYVASVRSTYSTQTMLMTGEVSLWKHLGFAFSAPMLKNVSEHAAGGAGEPSYLGWGDLVLGLQYQLPLPRRVRGFAFGPQLYLTTPTGNANANASLSRAARLPVPLQSGMGTVDLEARVSAGYDFDPIPVFVVAELGYHHHLDAQSVSSPLEGPRIHTTYSDDLPYLVRVGGWLRLHRRGFHHATLSFDLSGVRSLHNGGTSSSYENTPSPFLAFAGQFNNASSFSMGASLSWYPIRWVGLSYSVSHVLSGENTGYFLTNTVGIVSEF